MSIETQIVAAIYREKPALDFDDIVDEFELSLRSKSNGRCSLTFDHDDLVIIETEQLRVGLAWVEPDHPGQPYCLIVATGAAPDRQDGTVSTELCARLSEKILARMIKEIPHNAVFRAALTDPLDSDLLDKISAGLHGQDQEADSHAEDAAEAAPEDTAAHVSLQTTNEITTPEPQDHDAVSVDTGMQRLRAAYHEERTRDREDTSVVWQAMMLGANTLLETLSQGTELVRQVATTPTDPYARLKKRPRTRQDRRRVERFDRAEYELYGNLLD